MMLMIDHGVNDWSWC